MRNGVSCNDISEEYKAIGLRGQWWIGSYRHAMPYPKGNLYRAVRKAMGLSLTKMARHCGLTIGQWKYRELQKRMYHLAEILWLHEVSGMSWDDYHKLLNDCA